MIPLRLTKTMFTDIHNSWHGILIGALFRAVTGNVLLGIVVALFMLVLSIKLGDWHAKRFQEFNETPSVVCYTTSATLPATFTWFVMKGVSRVPGLKDAKASAEDIKRKFGVLGEPWCWVFLLASFWSLSPDTW